jgi:16S rRNA (guanine966-N2)-methyltransferase
MKIIAGEARGRQLLAPSGRNTRPPLDHIRKSLFSILAGSFEGQWVLDVFAGAGTFGLEAVSRGASHAVFVDSDRAAIAVLRKNVENLAFVPRCEVIHGDALREPDLASATPGAFALAFLDPPFKMLHDDDGREQVYRRLGEFLTSPALGPGANVVLRQPRKLRREPPFQVAETRVYGESVVHLFERQDPASTTELG